MVSIAEDFARELLFEVSEPALVSPNGQMRDDIWLRTEEQVEMTWERIREAWKAWHQVDLRDLTTFPMFPAFQGAVDARNAMMHGVGRLTRKQLRTKNGSQKYSNSMRAIGISTTTSHQLVVGGAAVEAVRECVVDFVLRLDGASP